MGWPSHNEFDLIQDPETGLALLAKRSGEETPEQERERQFWQLLFTDLRDWRAGDVWAVSRALVDCMLFNRPPPLLLLEAVNELCTRRMSDAEKRAHGDMMKHFLRWKAVKLVCGRHPNDPRNYKKKVRGDAVWREAAKLVANTGKKPSTETMKKSYQLIQLAGGAQVTLPSYRREVEKRRRRRKKNKLG